MPKDDLDDKKKIVLNQIIDSYLIDGAPVGSKTLSNKSEEMASSSSLRNIMSQLEVMGLIIHPTYHQEDFLQKKALGYMLITF